MREIEKKRPTIYDVARECGVSYQTVSRVLNNKPKVSANTRKRVLQAMKKLGYQRNLAAQMLTTQRSNTLMMVSVDGKFAFSFHATTETAKDAGYMTLLVQCTENTLEQTLEMASSRMVDGIYLYAPRLQIEDAELERMANGIPLVRRDYAINSRLTWVGFDQVRSAQILVQHLIDLGHRQIAEITGGRETINPHVRHESFISTILTQGLTPGPIIEGDYTTHERAMETGYEGAYELLRMGEPFTALVVANDHMAVGALHALRENNLRVPDDISVGSFDNQAHAKYVAPTLTTVDFNFAKQDQFAFQYLLQHIEDRKSVV